MVQAGMSNMSGSLTSIHQSKRAKRTASLQIDRLACQTRLVFPAEHGPVFFVGSLGFLESSNLDQPAKMGLVVVDSSSRMGHFPSKQRCAVPIRTRQLRS
ncbi:hypothetical protein V2G26_008184 [Clonostachys chloroleuca]